MALTQHGEVDFRLQRGLGHDVAGLATEAGLIVGCLCRERVLVLGQATGGSGREKAGGYSMNF